MQGQSESSSGEVMVLNPVFNNTITDPSPLSSSSSSSAVTREALVPLIINLYNQIAALESLSPSEKVNQLFSDLVTLCLNLCVIDVDADLTTEQQKARQHLILLCGTAEGFLEKHYARLIGAMADPHKNLEVFPYYENYRKLSAAEFDLLKKEQDADMKPEMIKKAAFVGSGPMPLTSIILTKFHMSGITIDNYDLDAEANQLAASLVRTDPDLSRRMRFVTSDVMDVDADVMASYDAVFLAALVGLDLAAKEKVVRRLSEVMRPGALLLVRSAYSARAFLYPVVPPEMLSAAGFDVTDVFDPVDDVVNSVIVARKCTSGS